MNPVEIAYSIPGQTWPRELTWLNRAFSASRTHVEIGVYCGRSFFATCLGLPHGATAVAVDDDSNPVVGTGFSHPCPEWVPTIRGMVLDSIRAARPDLTVEFWRMESLAASRHAMQRKLRGPLSVFIDGEHTFEAVCKDIGAWRPLLLGGIMCGHDYWSKDAGVMDAVDNSLGESFSVVSNTRIWLCDSRDLP